MVPQNPCRPVGGHGFGAWCVETVGYLVSGLAVVYDLAGNDLFTVLCLGGVLLGVALSVVLEAFDLGLEDAHGLAEATCHAGELGGAEEQDDEEDDDDDGCRVAENLAHDVPFWLEQVSDVLRLAESISSGDPSLDPLRPAFLFALFVVIVCLGDGCEYPEGGVSREFSSGVCLRGVELSLD